MGRGVAGVGGVVVLAVGGWLAWVLPGAQLAAVVGFGPVDGVVTIHRCYEGADEQGYATGTECTGRYTPRRSDGPARDIVLEAAAETYRPGSRVEVRTAKGRAYELSGTAVFQWAALVGLLLVPFLTVAAWLFACARRGKVANGDGYFFAVLAGLVLAIGAAAVAGILVAIGMAVF
ncbi:hypothetical protein ADK51_26880 [Streptomyces sp. WM6368]|nr:hypothetical protein ADK51_26880 [Streptomyces sp. WM6368]